MEGGFEGLLAGGEHAPAGRQGYARGLFRLRVLLVFRLSQKLWNTRHLPRLTPADSRRYNQSTRLRGDIAQLGERGVRNAEVGGSSPPISTISSDFSSFETPCFAPFSPQFVAKPSLNSLTVAGCQSPL